MVFDNTQMGGTNFAFPDVCLTPVAEVPVPLPYPNLSEGLMAIPTQFTVLIDFMPAHNNTAEVPLSQGDDTGIEMGVASGLDMGPTERLLCSVCKMSSVLPQTRMLDMTDQNSTNMVGATIVPAQVTCITLS